MKTFELVSTITGLLTAGEAFLLFFNAVVLAGSPNPWSKPLNLFLLAVDFCGGLVLLNLPWILGFSPRLGWGAAALLGCAHVYRGLEPLFSVKWRYCFNLPLSMMNVIKLLLLCLVLVIGRPWAYH